MGQRLQWQLKAFDTHLMAETGTSEHKPPASSSSAAQDRASLTAKSLSASGMPPPFTYRKAEP